jgi:hypothetical protein
MRLAEILRFGNKLELWTEHHEFTLEQVIQAGKLNDLLAYILIEDHDKIDTLHKELTTRASQVGDGQPI